MKVLALLLAVTLPQAYSQDCKDFSSWCNSVQNLCRDAVWINVMKKHCPKACGVCAVQQPPQGPCGMPQVQGSRVIAGDDATKGSWPWQILLRFHGIEICGGTLVSPNFVVTAAHCIDGNEGQPSSFKVRVGEHDFNSIDGDEEDIVVERIFKHPSYNQQTVDNDIAVLKLSRAAKFGKYVGPVCLPQQGSSVAVGTNCYITGWGKIQHPGNMHNLLQQGRLPVVSQSTCSNLSTKTTGIQITKLMVCAGYGGSSRLIGCHGDSGGPLVCNIGGKWVLHGVVSWGSGTCDSRKSYTVFARISEFRTWIDGITSSA